MWIFSIDNIHHGKAQGLNECVNPGLFVSTRTGRPVFIFRHVSTGRAYIRLPATSLYGGPVAGETGTAFFRSAGAKTVNIHGNDRITE
ncbi:hypothetical protein PXU57_004477 [Salmonella enterica subsp. enterica]|nr:hypothetical protein [Salmonella enterica subsp. enterica]